MQRLEMSTVSCAHSAFLLLSVETYDSVMKCFIAL